MNIRRPADQVATSSGEAASPATISASTVDSDPAGMAASTVGVRIAWVTPNASAVSASGAPGASRSGSAMTRAPPAKRDMHISPTEMSKLGEANCRTRLRAVMPSSPVTSATMLAKPVCVTATPFGRPVEPEV